MSRPATRTTRPDPDEVAQVNRILREYRLTLTEYFNLTGCADACSYTELSTALRYELTTPAVAQQIGFSLHSFRDWLDSPTRVRQLDEARERLATAQARRAELSPELLRAELSLERDLSETRRLWAENHGALLREIDDLADDIEKRTHDISLLDLPARKFDVPRKRVGRPQNRG